MAQGLMEHYITTKTSEAAKTEGEEDQSSGQDQRDRMRYDLHS